MYVVTMENLVYHVLYVYNTSGLLSEICLYYAALVDKPIPRSHSRHSRHSIIVLFVPGDWSVHAK